MRAQLIPLDGGKPINITRDVTVVGRKPGWCDITMDRGSVSKLQCVIVMTDGLLIVRDLGSTNGTKVNGQRVSRGALLPGDELAFASVRFRVQFGPDDPDVASDDVTEMLTDGLGDSDVEEYAAPLDESGSDSDVRLLSDDSVL